MKRPLRFGVIGAGPAGLSAAAALRRLGHENVTVFEKEAEVGGKCKSRQMGGARTEAGAVYVLPNYPVVESLARQVEVDLIPACPFVHRDAEGRTRPYGVPPPSLGTWSKVAEYGRFGQALVRHRQVFGRALGAIDDEQARQLSLPFGEWVKKLRLAHFHQVAYPLLRSFGFGYEEQEIPALYIVHVLPRLAPGGNFARLWDVSKLELKHVEQGYAELWRRVASKLDVKCGVDITRVERGEHSVGLETSAGSFEVDRLVLASPLDSALEFLDADEAEQNLFSRLRWLDVWQVSLRIEGIEDALILDENQDYARLGHALIAFRDRPGSDIYYLFGYAGPHMSDADIETNALDDVRALGARVSETSGVERFRYFPHFSCADVAEGSLRALQQLQGERHTWYVGEAVSNIGVEAAASHAEELMLKAFGRA
jgi:predicted NAD/FAD-dependent oxidoreductase